MSIQPHASGCASAEHQHFTEHCNGIERRCGEVVDDLDKNFTAAVNTNTQALDELVEEYV